MTIAGLVGDDIDVHVYIDVDVDIDVDIDIFHEALLISIFAQHAGTGIRMYYEYAIMAQSTRQIDTNQIHVVMISNWL